MKEPKGPKERNTERNKTRSHSSSGHQTRYQSTASRRGMQDTGSGNDNESWGYYNYDTRSSSPYIQSGSRGTYPENGDVESGIRTPYIKERNTAYHGPNTDHSGGQGTHSRNAHSTRGYSTGKGYLKEFDSGPARYGLNDVTADRINQREGDYRFTAATDRNSGFKQTVSKNGNQITFETKAYEIYKDGKFQQYGRPNLHSIPEAERNRIQVRRRVYKSTFQVHDKRDELIAARLHNEGVKRELGRFQAAAEKNMEATIAPEITIQHDRDAVRAHRNPDGTFRDLPKNTIKETGTADSRDSEKPALRTREEVLETRSEHMETQRERWKDENKKIREFQKKEPGSSKGSLRESSSKNLNRLRTEYEGQTRLRHVSGTPELNAKGTGSKDKNTGSTVTSRGERQKKVPRAKGVAKKAALAPAKAGVRAVKGAATSYLKTSFTDQETGENFNKEEKALKTVGRGGKKSVRTAKKTLKKVRGMKIVRRPTKSVEKKARKASQKAAKKTTKTTARITVRIVKAAVRVVKTTVRAVIRLLAAAGPIVIVALLVGILVSVFLFMFVGGEGIAVLQGEEYERRLAEEYANEDETDIMIELTNDELNVFYKLMEHFQNEDMVIGIMCCMMEEHKFSPTFSLTEPDPLKDKKCNEVDNFQGELEDRLQLFLSGGDFGYFKWTNPKVKTDYFNLRVIKAMETGKFQIADGDDEIDFMIANLGRNGDYYAVGRELDKIKQNAPNMTSEEVILETVEAWMMYYEMPSGYSSQIGKDKIECSANDKIISYANKIRAACTANSLAHDAAVYAINYCADNRHGYTLGTPYSTNMGDGLDLCCADFVSQCLHNSGIPIELCRSAPLLLTRMHDDNHFVDVTRFVDPTEVTKENNWGGFQEGDIIFLRDGTQYPTLQDTPLTNHTLLYVGEGRIAQASWDVDGVKGDGSGREVAVSEFNLSSYVPRQDLTQYTEKNASGRYLAQTKYLTLKSMVVYRYCSNSSGFIWPCQKHIISSPYGNRDAPVAGATTDHRAIDIGLPVGTDIYAVCDGTVTAVGTTQHRGIFIVIEHSNGYSTRSQHLSKPLVTVGQSVRQGQVIALSGNTGIGTAPHLHFEVYPPGKDVDGWSKNAIDPETVLP